jgi:mono/diheme cytochrome c family protein
MIRLAVMMLAAAAAAGAPDAGPDAQGARLYDKLCARCHGADMVIAGTQAFDLRRFPPEEHERFVTSVTKGKGNMPPWGDVLKDDEVEALWAYVRGHATPPP